MKDFAAEIRAHLDVEHFLSQAQLMLDWPMDVSAEQILDRMLHHLLDSEEPPVAYHDASKVLFTHKSGRHWMDVGDARRVK
jgi:solute carrier family 4 (sodium borate transporter), member 11